MQATSITVKLPTTSDIAVAGPKEDVVFTPEQASPELTAFVSRQSDETILGTRRISMRYTPATKQRNFAKSTMAVAVPKTGTLTSGAFGVLGTVRINVEVQIPETADLVTRRRAQVLLSELLSKEPVFESLFNLNPLY